MDYSKRIYINKLKKRTNADLVSFAAGSRFYANHEEDIKKSGNARINVRNISGILSSRGVTLYDWI